MGYGSWNVPQPFQQPSFSPPPSSSSSLPGTQSKPYDLAQFIQRPDLNAAYAGISGNATGIVGAAATAPGYVMERPLALLNTLTGSNPDTGQKGLVDQLAGPGTAIGDVLGGASNVLSAISTLPNRVQNGMVAQVLRGTYGAPDSTPFNASQDSYSLIHAIPGIGQIVDLANAFNNGGQFKTIGDFRSYAAGLGFTQQDIQDLHTGVKGDWEFADKQLSADPLQNLIGSLVLDPTNAIFGLGMAGKIPLGLGWMSKYWDGVNAARDAAGLTQYAPKLFDMWRTGRSLSTDWHMVPLKGLADEVSSIARGSYSAAEQSAFYAGKSLSTATKAYRYAGLGITGAELATTGADALARKAFGDNYPLSGYLEPLADFARRVQSNQPLSHNTIFSLVSALKFPLHDDLQTVRERISDFKASTIGTDVRPSVMRDWGKEIDPTAKTQAAAEKALNDAFGDPTGTLARQNIEWAMRSIAAEKVFPAGRLLQFKSEPALDSWATWSEQEIQRVTKAMILKGEFKSTDLFQRIKDQFTGSRNFDEYGSGVRQEWDPTLAAQGFKQFRDSSSEISQMSDQRAPVVAKVWDQGHYPLPKEHIELLRGSVKAIAEMNNGLVPKAQLREMIQQITPLMRDEPFKTEFAKWSGPNAPSMIDAKAIDAVFKKAEATAAPLEQFLHEAQAYEDRITAATPKERPHDPVTGRWDPTSVPVGEARVISTSRLAARARHVGMRAQTLQDVQATRAEPGVRAFEDAVSQAYDRAGYAIDHVTQGIEYSAARHELVPSVTLDVKPTKRLLADMDQIAQTVMEAGSKGVAHQADEALQILSQRTAAENGIRPNAVEYRWNVGAADPKAVSSIIEIMQHLGGMAFYDDTRGVLSLVVRDAQMGTDVAEHAAQAVAGLFPEDPAMGRLRPDESVVFVRKIVNDRRPSNASLHADVRLSDLKRANTDYRTASAQRTYAVESYFASARRNAGVAEEPGANGFGARARAAQSAASGNPGDVPARVKEAWTNVELALGKGKPSSSSGVLQVSSASGFAPDVADVARMPDESFHRDAEDFGKGTPGISQMVVGPNKDRHALVSRDAQGNVDGFLSWREDRPGQPSSLMVKVDPAHRREGIATRLYDEAQVQGIDLRPSSGLTVTGEGRAFTDSYWARKGSDYVSPQVIRAVDGFIDALHDSVNPADIPDQLARLRAAVEQRYGGIDLMVSRMRPDLGEVKTIEEAAQARLDIPEVAHFEAAAPDALRKAGYPIAEAEKAVGTWDGGVEPSLLVRMANVATLDDARGAVAAMMRAAEDQTALGAQQDAGFVLVSGERMARLGVESNSVAVQWDLSGVAPEKVQSVVDAINQQFPYGSTFVPGRNTLMVVDNELDQVSGRVSTAQDTVRGIIGNDMPLRVADVYSELVNNDLKPERVDEFGTKLSQIEAADPRVAAANANFRKGAGNGADAGARGGAAGSGRGRGTANQQAGAANRGAKGSPSQVDPRSLTDEQLHAAIRDISARQAKGRAVGTEANISARNHQYADMRQAYMDELVRRDELKSQLSIPRSAGDPKLVVRGQAMLDRLRQEFPDVRVSGLKIGDQAHIGGVTSDAGPIHLRAGTFSQEQWAKFATDDAARVAKSGLGFYAVPSVEGVVAHEFGHKVFAQLRLDNAPGFQAFVDRLIADTKADPISGYAESGLKPKIPSVKGHEVFAEAFAGAIEGNDKYGILPYVEQHLGGDLHAQLARTLDANGAVRPGMEARSQELNQAIEQARGGWEPTPSVARNPLPVPLDEALLRANEDLVSTGGNMGQVLFNASLDKVGDAILTRLDPSLKDIPDDLKPIYGQYQKDAFINNPWASIGKPPMGEVQLRWNDTVGDLLASNPHPGKAWVNRLMDKGPLSALAHFERMLFSPRRGSVELAAAKQAFYDTHLTAGMSITDINKYYDELEKVRNGFSIRDVKVFKSVDAMLPSFYESVARKVLPEDVVARYKGQFYKLADVASSSWFRNIERAAKAGGVRGEAGRMLEGLYFRGMGIRHYAKIWYHVARFLVDPRWWAMNLAEAEILTTAKYGVNVIGAADHKPGVLNDLMLNRRERLDQREPELALNAAANGWYDTRRTLGAMTKTFDSEAPRSIQRYLDNLPHTDPIIGMLEARFGRDTTRTWGQQLIDDAEKLDMRGAKATVEDEARRTLAEEDYQHLRDSGLLQTIWEHADASWTDIKRTLHGNPDRTLMERILNSYWLYWPLSYQLKAGKWIYDTLTHRFFGATTNLGGAWYIGQIQAKHEEAMKNDPAYADMFNKHPETWFAAQMMLPITPFDLSVGLGPLAKTVGGLSTAWDSPTYANDPLSLAARAATFGPVFTAELLQRIGQEAFPQPKKSTNTHKSSFVPSFSST